MRPPGRRKFQTKRANIALQDKVFRLFWKILHGTVPGGQSRGPPFNFAKMRERGTAGQQRAYRENSDPQGGRGLSLRRLQADLTPQVIELCIPSSRFFYQLFAPTDMVIFFSIQLEGIT